MSRPRRLLLAGGLLAGAIALALVLAPRVWRGEAAGETGAIDGEAFQLFVLGGSTASGTPYERYADAGRIAAVLLGDRLAGRRLVAVTLAESAQDTMHVLVQAREAAARATPGLGILFVYCSDNEFLRFDRSTSDEERLSRPFFDQPICSPDERAATVAQFERNLRAVAEIGRRHDLLVVLSTVGTNLRDWDPNRSVLAEPGHRPAVEQHLASATAARERGDYGAEEHELRALLELERGFAWGWYLLGRCLSAQGRHEEARSAFRHRVDSDGFPTSAPSWLNDVARRVAAELGLPLVDGERILTDLGEHGIPGFDVFWDNSHPRLHGHAALAEELARVLARELDPSAQIARVPAHELRRRFGIGQAEMHAVILRRAQYTYAQAALTWDREFRLGRSQAMLDHLLLAHGDDVDVLCSRAVVDLLRRDLEASRVFWRRAHLLDPAGTSSRASHPMVRRLSEHLGVRRVADLYR